MRISDWSSDVCSSDLEGLGGAGVDGAVDGRRSGAVARQLVEEEARDRHRVFRLGEALLLHQGVALQPVHELGAVGGDHLGLREVDVGVEIGRASGREGVCQDVESAGVAGSLKKKQQENYKIRSN